MANPIRPLAEILLECARSGLVSAGAELGRVCLTFGEINYDDCECGQLVLAVRRIYPSKEFPAPDEDPMTCAGALTAADMTISYTRCVPGLDDSTDDVVPCDELTDSGLTVYEESYAMYAAVMCCLRSLNLEDDHDAIVREGRYIGPNGICGGMEIDLTISLNDNCMCGDGDG